MLQSDTHPLLVYYMHINFVGTWIITIPSMPHQKAIRYKGPEYKTTAQIKKALMEKFKRPIIMHPHP
jgi:hypothetical protein